MKSLTIISEQCTHCQEEALKKLLIDKTHTIIDCLSIPGMKVFFALNYKLQNTIVFKYPENLGVILHFLATKNIPDKTDIIIVTPIKINEFIFRNLIKD